MRTFKYIDEVSRLKPFKFNKEYDQIFVNAMKENYEFQLTKHPYLKHMLDYANGGLDINTIEDIYDIPPIFVDLMKYHDLCSLPQEEIELTLTSSGTKGQKTKSFFDKGSISRLNKIASSVFNAIGYSSEIPVEYFVLSYDITKATDIGTSWSDKQMIDLAPQKSVHWMIEWDEESKQYIFDDEKWARLFIERSSEGPVRLLGFPAYMYKMVETIKKIHKPVKVDERSFILAGGGWKNHLGKSMSLKEFGSYMEKNIGLKPSHIGDTYGLAEHGIPYCSCEYGHYHIPQYSRVRVCDPLTLEPVPMGEEGMLHLLTPYNIAQPNLSLLSTDIVTLGENCPCNREGTYIKSIRRGGKKKHKGCAIAALEILKNSK